jgi:hypothetical protein
MASVEIRERDLMIIESCPDAVAVGSENDMDQTASLLVFQLLDLFEFDELEFGSW